MSYRAFGRHARGLAMALLLTLPVAAQADVSRGGTLRFLVEQEPTTLVTIAHTAGL
ncbi:hypothetical protein ACQR1Y_25095 [Bradyrhizobium sp. HKCCYLRH3099]|uniref:hypothetical protein n=1 Tax=unclassified Bradyrhizobium TaxID=2631580 RepID=UPI003EB8CF97